MGALQPGRPERIPVDRAVGRVTAAPVLARISSPHYHSSAMDGIAVNAASTFGANETRPVRLGLGADALVVDTGDPLPEGRNAGAIMIEDLHFADDRTGKRCPRSPWQHVRMVGEDFVGKRILYSLHTRRCAPTISAA